MEHERIFTETPKKSIWDRIDLLTTINGVTQELRLKCDELKVNLSDELLQNKAKGVAFCVRSARDLFQQSNSKNLTPNLTSIYYGTYNLLSALLIGRIDNELTLVDIENFSKNGGHGIKSIYRQPTENIELDEFIYCCDNGFFKEYLRSTGYTTANIVMPKNFRKIENVPAEHQHKLVSVKDLISRIPELKNIYVELFKEQPNYLNYHASKNYDANPETNKISINEFQNSTFLTPEIINEILNLPPEVIFEYRKENPNSSLKEEYRNDAVLATLLPSKPKYNSPISISCTIKPIVEIDDVLLIYFKSFYLLSIWTRYRPNLWREIFEGQYDQFRPLFSTLEDSAERIIPNLFLNKFYKRIFTFASHSYWS